MGNQAGKISVRPFRSKDAEAVVKIWQEVLPASRPHNEPMALLCRKRNLLDDQIFVAEVDDTIVGTVIAGYDGVRGWIYKLAVLPEDRNSGIGRALLCEAEQTLVKKGCVKVNLQVEAHNEDVVDFYQKCGYRTEERISLGKLLDVRVPRSEMATPKIRVNEEISLSATEADDRDAIVRHLNQSDEFHLQTCGIPNPYTPFDAESWLFYMTRATLENEKRINWAIRNAVGEMIGNIEIADILDKRNGSIGYWLAQPYWGRGIMTAVARRVCEFGFGELKLEKLRGGVLSTNPASKKVFQKLGFTQEATLRRHLVRNGRVIDLYLFGLLRDEWTE